MNILLTGGTGYIGSHTAVVLAEAGHSVILYDNLCNSCSSVVDKLTEICAQRMPFIHGDIRDTELLIRSIRDYRIDAVIHFAGLKAVAKAVENPIQYYENNVNGSISLLRAMQSTNVRKLIFSSSATVYGEPDHLPIDEDHPTLPTNPYGRSKLFIEKILEDAAQSEDDWNIVCLRYFNPVGAHQSALLGEQPNGIPNNLMPCIAKVAASELSCLNIFGDDYSTPDGTCIRDYVHVMDVADGHLASLNFLEKRFGWHAINLGTDQGFSVFEMISAFESVSNQVIKYKVAPRRQGDVASCYAKVEKAQRELAWRAHRSLEEMCTSLWLWQTQNRLQTA